MTSLPYRWELLVWLWLAFLFNQADRQVFNVVLPAIRAGLGLTAVQAGLVGSVFTIALAIVIPVAGYVGDIWSRKRIVVFSLFGWSVSTLLTGFSPGLLYLIIVRSVATGVGEGFYAPSAFAMIGEHHVETRAQAMALHQTSLYLGVVLSGLVAGWLGDHFGWRSAFWIFGSLGIAAALALQWRLRDAAPANRRNVKATPCGRLQLADQLPVRLVLKTLAATPTALLLAFGLGGVVFVNVGYLTWMPTYLHERFGMSLAAAGFSSMFYHHATAFLGVLLGGRVSDRLARTHPQARPLLQGSALLVGAPFLLLLGRADQFWLVCTALAGFGFFRGLYDSSTFASLYEVIDRRFHASATGAMTAFAFAIGSVAPVALGAVKQAIGLAIGLSVLSLVYLAASLCLFAAVFFTFGRDYAGVHPENHVST